jgi:elongation factor Ts
MAFTAKDVMELRKKTGCGMMDCKKALTAADGNMEAAVEFLREKGLAAATKKADRIAAEGLAVAYTNKAGNIGVALEVNSETDFVANNAEFKAFVEDCANVIIEKAPSNLDDLLGTTMLKKSAKVETVLQEMIHKIGENIKIRRFQRYEGCIFTYTHAGGKIGVMVKFDVDKNLAEDDDFGTLGKDIAMQIAAVSPRYINKADVPVEIADYEKKILKEQIVNEGKPDSIADKIVIGRMGKFYKDICLLEQPFVKENSINVSQHIENISKKIGAKIKVLEFVRFEKGEGLEKN